MKRFLSFIAFVALACAVAAKPDHLPEEKKILHPRTGHFAKIDALAKSYNLYRTVFDAELPKDHYENYRPSETNCYNYLRDLIDNKFKIERLVDFVKFDACLGVLYEDEPYLIEDPATRQELKQMTFFFAPYNETKIEEMTPDAQHCIGNLLTAAIHGRNQFAALNDNFIQLFIQLGQCTDQHLSRQGYLNDPYIKMIFDLVRKEAKLALKATVDEVKTFTENMYDRQHASNAADKVKSIFANKDAPSVDRLVKEWPKEVYELLSITQDEGEHLNIRSVHEKIKKFMDGEKFYNVPENQLKDPNEITLQGHLNSLLKIFGKKATKALVRKSNFQKLFPDGSAEFNKWKDNLCKPFLYSERHNKKDFALRLQRLIDITVYADLFEIDEEYMLTKVLLNAGKTSAIYLSLSICNILDYTRAKLDKTIPPAASWKRTKPLSYRVGLLSRSDMVRWPTLKYI